MGMESASHQSTCRSTCKFRQEDPCVYSRLLLSHARRCPYIYMCICICACMRRKTYLNIHTYVLSGVCARPPRCGPNSRFLSCHRRDPPCATPTIEFMLSRASEKHARSQSVRVMDRHPPQPKFQCWRLRLGVGM